MRKHRKARRAAIGAGLSAAIVASGLGVAAPAGAAPVPDGIPGGFQLVKEDLQFILKQIKVAEASPDGRPTIGLGEGQVASRLSGDGLRTVTGVYNNLYPGKDAWGAADEAFPRLLPPSFRVGDPLCVGPEDGPATSYNQPSGLVCDAAPRVVSNLIVDQTTSNPAAVASAGRQGTDGDLIDVDGDPSTPATGLFIPNTATDAGLSARFNAWFTLFGQFFDHGLDLVGKGGSGTVIVPLQPDDPLYQDPAGEDGELGTADDVHTNFMVLTRATNQPGPDGVLGTADDVRDHVNRTTAFVDQNQTYTSHPSHQVFLREYEMVDGVPVATGKLLDNPDGGLADWAHVKAQAEEKLGIVLEDTDVFDVPLVKTDLYGKFTPGADGKPQLLGGGTGHAFLDDIAHHAVPDAFDHDNNPGTPGIQKTADGDDTIGDDGDPTTYDDEMLARHFITGDGRGNENIGLTAVHHVFHSEHNRVLDDIKALIDAQTDDPAFQEEWKLAAGAEGWNGERLFQAARLVTEMQYQHLVFEEFARKISPNIDILPRNESGYSPVVDPAITAEFAHVVYRFGHSMLTEDVRRTLADGSTADMSLFDAFLNPVAFTNDGQLTPEQAAGAIVRGNIYEVGNEIDEFVTDALRNRLVGLPLDLATLNLARARDTGVPGLNAARRTFYAATEDGNLAPYTSWNDFGASLRNRESLVNFVAAYGTHPSLEGADTLAAKRAAAVLLVSGGAGAPEDRVAFMEGSGTWSDTAASGLEDIEFWIGGLAEKPGLFGSMLGSSFNFVFENQLENLQFGDRFYYLSRLNGTNLLSQLENNSFGALISRNSDAASLPFDVFATPDCTIDLSNVGPGDPLPSVAQCGPGASLFREANGTIRFTGPQHVHVIGSSAADRIRTDEGDDTIHGTGGGDRIEGGDGVDALLGGDGDDHITDVFGDDTIKGGSGNDRINPGPGFDLVFGGSGKDFIVHGTDGDESIAGLHDDFVRGGAGNDVIAGNLGDDWVEGGAGFDLVQGDNANNLQNDPAGGDDVLTDVSGNDDYDAEGGDDIMVASTGANRNGGMLGFDWVTNARQTVAADDDMTLVAGLPLPGKPFADRFDLVEGLSGWDNDDILRGDNRDAASAGEVSLAGHELTDIDKIDGLRAILGADVAVFTGGNILLGGAGSDLIEGRGGDDVIDGDAWLDVRLQAGGSTYTSLGQLQNAVFDGTINPGDIEILRQVVVPTGQESVTDTAVFSGNRSEYTFPDGLNRTSMRVVHTGGTQADGTDTLRNIERLQFADQIVEILPDGENSPGTGTITINDTTPTENQVLSVTHTVADANGIADGTLQIHWQFESVPGTWTTFAEGASSGPLGDAVVGKALRVEITYVDGLGVLESVSSNATAAVRNVNDAPTGAPVLSPTAVTEGQAISVSTASIADADGLGTLRIRWQQSALGGSGTWATISGATSGSYTPGAAQVNRRIRAVVSWTDANGTAEQVASNATSVVGDRWIGTAAANVFNGTNGSDWAEGRGGNDTLNGRGGADLLEGEAGNDRVDGGAGDDVLLVTGTGQGFDTFIGGTGHDTIRAGAAGTVIGVLLGLTGIEEISSGGFANVTLSGSGSSESLDLSGVVLSGIAAILGGGGADDITGSAGDDVIRGGAGDDSLLGGTGSDQLFGDAGIDLLNGGGGDDTLTGGTGLDEYVFRGSSGFGTDTVVGFDSNPAGGQELLDIRNLGVTAANFSSRVSISYDSATATTTVVVKTAGGATIGTIVLPGVGGSAATAVTSADFRV